MADYEILRGTTSKTLPVTIGDTSDPNGGGLTGLVFNTSGLTAYYYREGANAAVAITLVTMTLGTWTSSGFIAVDGTNMPGEYQIGLPDAALASSAGVNYVEVMLKGAANMAPVMIKIELTSFDLNDAVRGGMSALPNAAAEASGGLYTRGTGAGQINQPANGMVDTNVVRWLGTAAAAVNTAGVPVVDTRQIIRQGTAQSTGNSTTAIKLDSGASATDGFYKGMLCQIISGTGSPQIGLITAYVGSTKVATIAPAWPTAPDNTSVFQIDPAMVDVETWLETAVAATTAGIPDVNVKTWLGGAIPAVNVTGVPKVDVVDWLGSAPDALSSGKLPADVKLWLASAPDALSSGKVAADLKLWLATAPLALSSQQVQAIVTAYASGQAPLQPTTAGRTLDVSTGGEAGLDWANIGSPTTTVGLSGTTVKTATDVETDTQDIQSRLPAALVSGRIDASVGAYPGNTAQTGDNYARLGAPAGASIAADLAEIEGETDTLLAGVIVTTNNDKTGYSLAAADSPIVNSGTATAGAASTITLAAGASATDSLYVGQTVKITSGTGAGQVRVVTAYVGSTKVATVDRAWQTNPDNTSVYAVLATDAAKTNSSLETVAASVTGAVGSVTGAVGSVTGAVGSVTGNVGGNVTGSVGSVVGAVGSVTGAVGSVTGNVGGNVVGSTASVTAGVTVTTNNDKTGYGLSSAAVQAVWDALTSALTTAGSIGKLLVDNVNATISSRLASASISLSGGAVTVGTNNDKTGYTASTVTDKTGYALTAGEHTAIASDAQTGLTAQGYTTTRAGYLDTLNGLVQAIWDKATSALATAGSIGKLLVDNINATISSRLPTSSYTAPPSAASISTQTWSEALPGSFGAGTAGADLDAAAAGGGGGGGDPWLTTLPGAYGAGTAGKIVGDNVNATISSRSSHSAADVWAVGTRTLTSFGTLATDVWSVGTRTLTSFGSLVADVWAAVADSAGVTTLLSRLTGTRATNLDDLDATITSRMPSGNVTVGGYAAGEDPATLLLLNPANLLDTDSSGRVQCQGVGAGAFEVVVTVQDANTLGPLFLARVTVYDATNTTVIDQRTTDVNGNATFALDAAIYEVKVEATGFTALLAQELDISANTSVVYALTPASSLAPGAPGVSVVNVSLLAPDASPAADVVISSEPVDPLSGVDDSVIRRQILTATTDANGLAQLQLIQASSFKQGSGKYRVSWLDGHSIPTVAIVSVPDTPNPINLQEML